MEWAMSDLSRTVLKQLADSEAGEECSRTLTGNLATARIGWRRRGRMGEAQWLVCNGA